MRILVACEFSGRVRDAFIARGHDAISCDLVPSEQAGPHFQENVLDVIAREKFDLMIAHPPCTHLAVSGSRWFDDPRFPDKRNQQIVALQFVRLLMEAPIQRIAIENPVSIISSHIRKPDQIIQPYWFGDPFSKRTCLWLKNLPLLKPTSMVEEGPRTRSGMPKWYGSPGKHRSRTFLGVANAMAEQWGNFT